MLSLINSILDSPNGTTRRPVLRAHFESNIPGLHIIGDLAGAPVVKLAMEQGSDLADYLAIQPDAKSKDLDCWDIIIAGAGAAGLNAALVAQ